LTTVQKKVIDKKIKKSKRVQTLGDLNQVSGLFWAFVSFIVHTLTWYPEGRGDRSSPSLQPSSSFFIWKQSKTKQPAITARIYVKYIKPGF
jgi:hypothetical protein